MTQQDPLPFNAFLQQPQGMRFATQPATAFYQPPPSRTSPALPPWMPPSSPITVHLPAHAPPPTPTPTPSQSRASAADGQVKWTENDRKILGEMLLADKNTSCTQQGHKQDVYVAIVEALNTQVVTGGNKTVRSCQSQKDYIFKHYWEPLHTLVGLSGFGWDPDRNVVTADDSVWDSYIKAHDWAKKWRGRSWPLYDLFNQYFEGSRAHGKNVVRPGRPFVGLGGDNTEGETESPADDTESSAEQPARTPRRRNQGPESLSKRKTTAGDSLLAVAESIRESNELTRLKLRKKSKMTESDRLGEAIGHVMTVEWLDDEDKVRMINLLGEQPRKVDLLLSVMGNDLEQDLVRTWLY